MKKISGNTFTSLTFKAIAFAMSVAVIVLTILGAASISSSILLLAIGMFCLALLQIQK